MKEEFLKISLSLETLEQNKALEEETNFLGRVEAIEFINFHLLSRLEARLANRPPAENLRRLIKRAEALQAQLEEKNKQFFQTLRMNIKSGAYSPELFRQYFNQYVWCNSQPKCQDDIGYDSLDLLVNGLLGLALIPVETGARDPEMVFYQPTPVRVILELIDKAKIEEQDVFYDLGSGLGQVPLLVNLLSGARAKGVEVEPAYHVYAQQCASSLNLLNVEFINLDARQANYSDGTIFFMYTPFKGRMLQTVSERLRLEAQKRAIKVCTYGPCTLQVSKSNWLNCLYQNGNNEESKLAIFKSAEKVTSGGSQ
jgi:hypothetical protein